MTVDGGATRAGSVANALAAVETEYVAIHDAARPLLTATLLERTGRGALVADPEADAIIAAAPVTDTVKKVRVEFHLERQPNSTRVSGDRRSAELWGAQTPQVFRTKALRDALEVDEEARDAATDEAMLIEAAGGKVLIHDAGAANLKVTTPLDLRVAELLLAERAAARGLVLERPVAAAAEQDVDQHRGEGQLADPERRAEVDRAERQGGEDADEEGGGEQKQLTTHRC